MTPLGRYVLETVLSLLAVAGLAVVVLYVFRRSGVGRPTGPLALAGRLALDARRTIYLVRVAETVYVIGASEAGLTKLGELPRDALGSEPTLHEDVPRPFRDFLRRAGTPRDTKGSETRRPRHPERDEGSP